jgi:atypical dual specificity phosphatase
MWTWSLNWGEITDSIVIGTCPMAPDDLSRIQSHTGVSAILSLQHDDCLAYWNIDYEAMVQTGKALGLVMQRCPIKDFNVPDIRKRLPAAIRMLANMINFGHKVYVHCTAGLGRAPVVVLAYLILVEGYSAQDAIERILQERPGAVPAWEAFYGCREDLAGIHRQAIEQRAYELYEAGVHGDAHSHWLQAQADILRWVLTHAVDGCEA